MIKLIHLAKSYPDCAPLTDINADIREGDVISIIGGSGTGKSTLLNCINLLDPPTGGEVILDGECITRKGYPIESVRQKVGMVFQSFNLFNNLTAVENVMVAPMDILGVNEKDAYRTAKELLESVGMLPNMFKYPDELSGGQKQRVAIARTLAMNPEVILFDEPTSALDPASVAEVQDVIMSLAKAGRTMLIVTHDMDFAKSVANRVFFLADGIIYEEGTPKEVFDHPQREKTKEFFRQNRCMIINIDSDDVRLNDITSKLLDFSLTQKLTDRAFYRCSGVCEEMCMNVLPPLVNRGTVYTVEVEALKNTGSANKTVRLTFNYEGSALNFQKVDPTVQSLIQGYARKISIGTGKVVIEVN